MAGTQHWYRCASALCGAACRVARDIVAVRHSSRGVDCDRGTASISYAGGGAWASKNFQFTPSMATIRKANPRSTVASHRFVVWHRRAAAADHVNDVIIVVDIMCSACHRENSRSLSLEGSDAHASAMRRSTCARAVARGRVRSAAITGFLRALAQRADVRVQAASAQTPLPGQRSSTGWPAAPARPAPTGAARRVDHAPSSACRRMVPEPACKLSARRAP